MSLFPREIPAALLNALLEIQFTDCNVVAVGLLEKPSSAFSPAAQPRMTLTARRGARGCMVGLLVCDSQTETCQLARENAAVVTFNAPNHVLLPLCLAAKLHGLAWLRTEAVAELKRRVKDELKKRTNPLRN